MLKVLAHDRRMHMRVSHMAMQLCDLAACDVRRWLVIARPTLVNWAGVWQGHALHTEYYHGVKCAWARQVGGEELDDAWEVPLREVSSPADC